MLFGPVFGAVAVILTGADDEPARARRDAAALEGASTAASVPSILGYIAIATAGNEVLRGKAVGPLRGRDAARPRGRVRRRAAAVRGPRPGGVPPQRAALRRLVPDLPLGVEDPEPARPRPGGARRTSEFSAATSTLLPDARTSGSWRRPGSRSTRSIGLWFSQSIFQFAQGQPASSPISGCMRGFSANPDLAGGRRHRRSSSGPGSSTGATGSRALRRTTIILLRHLRRRRRWSAAGLVVNHARRPAAILPSSPAVVAAGARAVRAGRRDAGGARPARRHVRALPDGPRRDHGPLLGVPRASARSSAPHRRVSPPTGAASTACSSRRPSLLADRARAARRLRQRGAHRSAIGAPSSARRRLGEPRTGVTPTRSALGPVPLARGRARRGRRAAPPRHGGRARSPAGRRPRGRRGDRHERRPRRRHAAAAAASAATRSG